MFNYNLQLYLYAPFSLPFIILRKNKKAPETRSEAPAAAAQSTVPAAINEMYEQCFLCNAEITKKNLSPKLLLPVTKGALHCIWPQAAPKSDIRTTGSRAGHKKIPTKKARIHARNYKIPFLSLAGLTVIAEQAVLLASDHRSTTPSQTNPVT